MKVKTLVFLATAAAGAYTAYTIVNRPEPESESVRPPRMERKAVDENPESKSPDWPERLQPASIPRFVGGPESDAGPGGTAGGDLQKQFIAEPVDPKWGPAMEDLVAGHFDPPLLRQAGLDALRIQKIECRASLCVVVMEYPRDLMLTMVDRGLLPQTPPVALLEAENGPVATVATFGAEEDFDEGGTRMKRVTVLYGFKGDARALNQHAVWSRDQQPRMQKELENLRAYAKRHRHEIPE